MIRMEQSLLNTTGKEDSFPYKRTGMRLPLQHDKREIKFPLTTGRKNPPKIPREVIQAY